MHEQFKRIPQEDPTVVIPAEKRFSMGLSRENEPFQFEQRDAVGESARALRESRKQLSNEAWVKRVLVEMKEGVGVPDGFIFQDKLQQELGSVSPEGVHQRRENDAPPPPLADLHGNMMIPKKVYGGGLVWEVGAQLGEGGFGKVFEVRHVGGEQRSRLVKIMMIKEGMLRSPDKRGLLWNEIGALMAAGDFVVDETIYDEEGNLWTAVVMERHEGRTLLDVIREEKEGSEAREKRENPKWAYQQAVALRGIVSVLRRMHSSGWTHRDIKPANIISNLTEGEESLTRPIDFGSATRDGAIRRKVGNLVIGTPNYLLPETFRGEDVDLRIRDYWSSVLSIGLTVGLFEVPQISSVATIYTRLEQGEHIQSPDLRSPSDADLYFKNTGVLGAHRDFLQWLYLFIQPHMALKQRQGFWRSVGITKTIDVPPVDSSSIQLFPEEEVFIVDEADFLDDDKFVRELEDHIRALATQAGIEMPEGMLENLQEFPAGQTSEERIFES